MTAKQYLQSYKDIERRYNTVIEEIKEIEGNIISLRSPSFEDEIKGTPKNDPIGELVISMEEEKGKLAIKLMYYKAKMQLIKSQIVEMESVNSNYYTILILRYVMGKDWDFICKNLVYSRTQANRIHCQALQEFDLKYGKIYKNM
jgi:hypothetical protein